MDTGNPSVGHTRERRPEPLRSPHLLRVVRWWARRELGRSFDGLYVGGLEAAQQLCHAHPTLVVTNHASWWDALVGIALDEALGTAGYALMDAENLCRISLFTRLGGIPLDRQSPARLRAGLRAAAALLDRPGRAVWILPQGHHRPAHLRPLGFQPGVRLLARLAPQAAVLPVGLQYAFGETHRPVAYACFGTSLSAVEVAGEGGVERVEQGVAAALATIDRALSGEDPPLPPLIPPRRRLVHWTTSAPPPPPRASRG